jgi:hypothetical protein
MKSNFRVLLSSLVLLTLVACGGGGSTLSRDDNGGGGASVIYDIELSLVETGTTTESNMLSSAKPLTVSAKVSSSDGSSVEGMVVTFSFDDPNLATFSVENGRAVTGADGIAQIGLIASQSSGSGYVIATVDSITTPSIGFTSAGDGGQNASVPAYLNLSANSLQLASSGSDEIELIALVKSSQQVLIEGAEVRFSVEGDAALQQGLVLTGTDGKARTILTTGENAENRNIIITASTGTSNPIEQEIVIQVVGTEISINGPASIILNTEAEYTVLLTDSDGKPIANEQLNLSTNTGVLTNVNPVTNTSGIATVVYTSTSSGNDIISANALNASTAFNVIVQQDDFSFTSVPDSEIALNQSVTLTVTWEKNGVPYPNGDITFVASRGVISNVDTVTNAQGQANFTLTSSNAGFSSISSTGEDAEGNIVSARSNIEFIATVANSILVDASPDSIGPDGQTATISAIIRDLNGNLVKGKTIVFSVTDVSGGRLNPATGITDSSGIASTVYTSVGTTKKEGVKVVATVQDKPSVNGEAYLTVADREFDISFGTGSTILLPDNDTSSYLKEFAVYVSDAEGNAVSGANLTVSLTPEKFIDGGQFRKGFWAWIDINKVWEPQITAYCSSEDQNDNGIRDGEGTGSDEDTNQDGDLTPGIVGVVSFKDGSSTTNNNGRVTLQWEYPKEFAVWTDMVLTVKGSSTGSEGQQSQKYTLPIAGDDINDQAKSPPANPYGSGPNCTDTN